MEVKALIVGIGVLRVMSQSPNMVVGDYDTTVQIQKIGYYGLYPVYLDESLAPDKLMFTYTLDPGEKEPDADMVERWRESLPENPDGEDWVLLTNEQRKHAW